ncbi:MAG TPA: dTDP-glucose 4,6-dehydratase, partial [Fimbriimonadaceae bacterium]|nr:dTDP-glucose 4,6-dehydratase [Fimbriimonadaceae bacterium]
NYFFERVDLAEADAVFDVFERHRPDWVVHFAAETHVDRSIQDPKTTLDANITGTFNLLEASRLLGVKLFHQVGTDEVFGSLGPEGRFCEITPYDPSSPYSASKAASDHLVRSWQRTYGLNTRLTNCTNNYGPRQFPEKLMPLMILNAAAGKDLPVYGDGSNIRDWLFVEDHCEAIWLAACKGGVGETYTVGGNTEVPNLQIVHLICEEVAKRMGKDPAEIKKQIKFVTDRPGHDWRYAVDTSKIQKKLGWQPRMSFQEGLAATVDWYLANGAWVESVRSGDYLKWMQLQYGSKP